MNNQPISFSHIEVIDDATAEMLRRKTPAEKIAIVCDANDTLRILVAGGIRWQHPGWTQTQVQEEVARRMTREAN
jgi:hypothetical protein